MTPDQNEMISRRLLKGRADQAGRVEGRGEETALIIEPSTELTITPPIAAYPADVEIDHAYQGGPTFVMHVPGGYADPASGFVFDRNRNFIRESAVVGKYADKAAELFPKLDFDNAYAIRSGLVAVVSNQRSQNYCRWWLDTVAKFYLFETFTEDLLGPWRPGAWISPPRTTGFHAATLELLGYPPPPSLAPGRLVQGDLLVSSGLTFAGGQNISPQAHAFGEFVLRHAGLSKPMQDRGGRRLFISRRATVMRRIVNEPMLYPGLEARGFEVLVLEEMPLRDQIAAFADADVVLAPHGAGLTNLAFTRPGAMLIEIFPDCGVHSSAFRRIASQVGIDYALYAAPSRGAARKNNLRNIDLEVDVDHLFGFVDPLLER